MNTFRRLALWAVGMVLGSSPLLAQNDYLYTVNLNNVRDDRIKVELRPPTLPEGQVKFHLPKIVPGTYEIYDFGRFIENLQAYDSYGNLIEVTHPDVNTWVFPDGSKILNLTYEVNDTWDAYNEGKFVFEPGGTNIEANSNFVLNGHGVFGWFAGKKEMDFSVDFVRPDGWYGASALKPVRMEGKDRFTASNYFNLVDSPIMYAKPDTTTIRVGEADVLVGVYSKSGNVTSKWVADEIKEILKAQRAYLGGKLPVDRYAFIIYFTTPEMMGSGSYGALEHHKSSLYFLPEMEQDFLRQTVRDMAAHEFFHIVTPLNIHSEHIEDYDFLNPQMSRHLWLYEGVTEYSAGHVQIRHGLIDFQQYLEMLDNKASSMEAYNDTVPFTYMSQHVLDRYEEEYGNVYEKGALIGMGLDILIRKHSQGKRGLQDVLRELSAKYGPNRPFEDAKLFAELEAMTYPEVGTFLRRYVGGPEPLPMQDLLAEVGIHYELSREEERISLGFSGISLDGDMNLIVSEVDNWGRKVGMEEGDILFAFDGTEINLFNVLTVLEELVENTEEGDKIKIEVKREVKGKEKLVKLKGKAQKRMVQTYDRFVPFENPSPAQVKLRRDWLGSEARGIE